jgi:hypothetical protein
MYKLTHIHLSIVLRYYYVAGEETVATMRAAGITTTHQLIGKYLMFIADGIAMKEYVNAFYDWMTQIGVNAASRPAITRAIAEKVAILIWPINDGLEIRRRVYVRTQLYGLNRTHGGTMEELVVYSQSSKKWL